jgi:monoamine oxidase
MATNKNVASIDLANTAASYYAPATVTANGGLIHVSGQPGSADNGSVPSDYESQIHLALLKLRRIIIAAGASINDIVKLTVYVVGYNAAARKHTPHLMRFLGNHRPAITLVPVNQLAVPSWLFEIDAVLSKPALSHVSPALGTPKRSVDVIIIGAGLAGLTAAHEVMSKGYTCVILEARDRVGGKTWSQPLEGGKGVVDLGAAWINDTSQTKMYGLAKRFNADLIEQNTQGNCVFQGFDGQCSPFSYGDLPNVSIPDPQPLTSTKISQFDAATRKHLVDIRDMVEADCQKLDALQPLDKDLDKLTFEAYLISRGADENALATATVWTRAMLGVNPTDLSALFFLNYCKSGGGLLAMRSDRKGGGQHLRIRQGTQLFANGLARTLSQDVIHLESPVQAIVQHGRQAVYVQTGETAYSARKLITTVPGPALRDISFTPQLPPAKRLWIESTGYGYYTKAMMEFRSPFWVQKGLCGLVQSFVGPASVVRDTSSPADSKYVLTCFMAGDPGRAWSKQTVAQRQASLLEQLQQLYGVQDLKAEFVGMHGYDWVEDQYSGWGCPCASLTPGVMDTVGADALRQPWYDVHFAGTETAGEWKGYMEGAVRSGERAAAEVVQHLGSGITAKL